MTELLLTNLDGDLLERLQQHAISHRRSLADEAKALLAESLKAQADSGWQAVDDIYNRLAASGRSFTDSVELLREDRER